MTKQKVETIKVNLVEAKKASYRGARAAWLERLVKFNNKPVSAFRADVTKNPPSTPKTGKYAGKCEPPKGWIQFFTRQKLVEIVTK